MPAASLTAGRAPAGVFLDRLHHPYMRVLSFRIRKGGDRGLRYSACDIIALVEGCQTRGGIGLHPRLVLRYPTPECRRFRRHGGGGLANIAHSAMHRGI